MKVTDQIEGQGGRVVGCVPDNGRNMQAALRIICEDFSMSQYRMLCSPIKLTD